MHIAPSFFKLFLNIFLISAIAYGCGESASSENKSTKSTSSSCRDGDAEKRDSYQVGQRLKSSRMGRSCSEMYGDYQSLVYDYTCFCEGLND